MASASSTSSMASSQRSDTSQLLHKYKRKYQRHVDPDILNNTTTPNSNIPEYNTFAQHQSTITSNKYPETTTTTKNRISLKSFSTDSKQSSPNNNNTDNNSKFKISKLTFYLFYWNVFCSCVSFALVVPSLWPYLHELDSNPSFLGWCVSVYSIGELFGAIILGPMHNKFGTKFTLLLSVILGIIGSFLYGTAGFIINIKSINNIFDVAPYFVLFGRLLQGIWTGGEQAVETAYIGENVNKKDRTKLLSTLSTFATMGFVLGPAIGTPLETFEIHYDKLEFTGNMIPGYFIMIVGIMMFFATMLIFKERPKSKNGNQSYININSTNNSNDETDNDNNNNNKNERKSRSSIKRGQYNTDDNRQNGMNTSDTDLLLQRSEKYNTMNYETITPNASSIMDNNNNNNNNDKKIMSASNSSINNGKLSIPRIDTNMKPHRNKNNKNNENDNNNNNNKAARDLFYSRDINNNNDDKELSSSNPANRTSISDILNMSTDHHMYNNNNNKKHNKQVAKHKSRHKKHDRYNNKISDAGETSQSPQTTPKRLTHTKYTHSNAYLNPMAEGNQNTLKNNDISDDDDSNNIETISFAKVDNLGIGLCCFIFLIHFEGFAIQETITTVLVQDEFNWSQFDANYLFTGSGILTMLVVGLVAFASKLFSDYSLLMISLWFGMIGHATLADWNWLFPSIVYTEQQFLFGFAFITIAFSLGRLGSLSMYSKIIGPHPQGHYMGWIFTMGAISRILAPLFAVKLYFVNGPTLMFGSTAILFLICIILLIFLKSHMKPHKQIDLVGESCPDSENEDNDDENESSFNDVNNKIHSTRSNEYLNNTINLHMTFDDNMNNESNETNEELQASRTLSNRVHKNSNNSSNASVNMTNNNNNNTPQKVAQPSQQQQARSPMKPQKITCAHSKRVSIVSDSGDIIDHKLINSPLGSPAANRLGVLGKGLSLDTTPVFGAYNSKDGKQVYVYNNPTSPPRKQIQQQQQQQHKK